MVRCRLLRLRRTSVCHGTSCGSSCGSSSTTSPMLCDRVPRHVVRLVVDHAPSCRSTSRRSVALALAVRLVTASRGAATRRPDCTVSLALMPCIRTRRLTTRLLVNRSHWLSQCVRSLCLAAQLLVVRIAPALLRLCRASGRAVSPLDFLSVGRTSSNRAFGHCLSRRDYSSSGLHRLYCAYVVHPDAPSHYSTSRQSVALALAVCPVIPLCVVSTHLMVATDILCLRCASGCLDTSRGSSRGSSRRSSSTFSPTPCV
jgi:hypothetical protein